MVPGITISNLVERVLADASAKADFIVPTSGMRMEENLSLGWGTNLQAHAPEHVNDHALGQISEYLGIPSRFVDRMRSEAPDLIHINVNRLLENKKDDRRMIRTLHGNVRAFMSDRYRRLDHEDVAERILPMVDEHGFVVRSANVTESKLYLHVVSPKLEGEIRKGDAVRMGWVISNSEIGMGSLSLQLFIERLVCTNGMVVPEFSQRRAHLGARVTEESFLVTMSDETRRANDDALWFGVRDHLREFTTMDGLSKVLGNLREKADSAVTGDPVSVVEVLGSRFALQEEEKKSVLYHYLEGNDHTRWGLANAVTRLANASENYDRAVMLEARGGEVMALNQRDWNTVATAH